MNINVISVVPLVGEDEQELLFALSDGNGNVVHATIEEINFLAQWITENVTTEEVEEVEEYSEPEPTPQPIRRRASARNIDDLVIDPGEDGPMKVVKSPRPTV